MRDKSASALNLLVPAAQYLRMSTDDQRYSMVNQITGIRDYAVKHSFNVVQTYEDSGKSGLVLKHRQALVKLLRDVLSGDVPYKAILVYDISRWGRFQDADESAYYEFICKNAGVPVHYCAEQFPNDTTPLSALVKAIKRSMAAEFSRELGVKVFNGKKRIVQLGFWVGGEAGYGYQRLMVSADGKPKQKLRFGERKSLTTDRVVLIPGNKKEIATIRHLFEMAARTRLGTTEIARRMNESGMLFQEHLWSNVQVANVLTNPKYAGWNVWARHSVKLQGKRTQVPPEAWITKPGAFPPLVDQATFDRAQKNLIRQADRAWSNEELKTKLKRLLATKGRLSESIILRARGMCSPNTLKRRFGGYRQIYETIGYRPAFRDFYTGPRAEAAMCVRRDLVERIRATFPQHIKVTQQRMRTRSILWVDDSFYVAVLLCRRVAASPGCKTHWSVCANPDERDYITLLCRLNAASDGILTFHLFSRVNIEFRRSREDDPWLASGRRLEDLGGFYNAVKAIRKRAA
jgi:DNA invertase Pin-like site-specific DNA recombinase